MYSSWKKDFASEAVGGILSESSIWFNIQIFYYVTATGLEPTTT